MISTLAEPREAIEVPHAPARNGPQPSERRATETPTLDPRSRRLALARAVVRLLSATIPDAGLLRLDLEDGTAGPATMANSPLATLTIHGPDALGRMIWPPTPRGERPAGRGLS